jgi:hypothetical protein
VFGCQNGAALMGCVSLSDVAGSRQWEVLAQNALVDKDWPQL